MKFRPDWHVFSLMCKRTPPKKSDLVTIEHMLSQVRSELARHPGAEHLIKRIDHLELILEEKRKKIGP